ncbi:MAG TPA: trehalase-like domain-containing protein [Casimicrobiaceae bacterium]|nr:trehalase-like domain-containing protein [Casimicrobiaceae bacterium]
MSRPDTALPIEDYALIGNTRTAALVGRNGSIDWFCAPRFDSSACFAALLGTSDNGRWLLAPAHRARRVRRRYRDGTLVLETDFESSDGLVRVIDAMPLWDGRTDVVRIVEGLRGRVAMRMELVVRFGYGATVPRAASRRWRADRHGGCGIAGAARRRPRPRSRLPHRRGFFDRPRTAHVLRAHTSPVPRAAAPADRSRRGRRRHAERGASAAATPGAGRRRSSGP